ncbi:MAG: T9SS type A sorting domain-containing protein [Saprospiraceae bacterium]|nr:T9SS type A sorting domain-containing protein [Saprospiraceae bacterium]
MDRIIGLTLHSAALWFFLLSNVAAQSTIHTARQSAIGTAITVQGVVLNGEELGPIRYVQDSTGGIGVYPGNGSVPAFSGANPGDIIRVSGTLTSYRGLLEINPVTAYEAISEGNALPVPKSITLAELGPGNEGELIKISCVQWTSETTFAGGEILVSDEEGTTSTVYFRGGHPLIGQPVPAPAMDIIGISSRFDTPQILPRSQNDFTPAACINYIGGLISTDIGTHTLTFSFLTSNTGMGGVRYQLAGDTYREQMDTVEGEQHQVMIPGLEPATIYSCQPFLDREGHRSFGPASWWITESESSGMIEAYFNYPSDSTYSSGLYPNGNSGKQMESRLKNLIDNATSSIDFCAYNINQDWIVTALNDAVYRGVRVRYIGNDGTSNTSLGQSLEFPVLLVNPYELMHNKFIVVDAGETDKALVWTGSVNFTIDQMEVDPNDCLIVQDQSLARVYQEEFEEMWGGSGSQPTASNSKSSRSKSDNTPHLISIRGMPVESYFSPSDQTNKAIIKALKTSDKSLAFGVLSFTRDDIADVVIAKYQEGKTVRGIIENIDDQGGEFERIRQAGVPVISFPAQPIFHHKMGIVDYDQPDSDPLVLTGSHNWTTAAENDNDENLLILHSAGLANIYRQAFEAIYSPSVSFREDLPLSIALGAIFPNPVGQILHVQTQPGFTGHWLQIFNSQGQLITAFQQPGGFVELDLPVGDWLPGWYVLRLEVDGQMYSQRLIKSP